MDKLKNKSKNRENNQWTERKSNRYYWIWTKREKQTKRTEPTGTVRQTHTQSKQANKNYHLCSQSSKGEEEGVAENNV